MNAKNRNSKDPDILASYTALRRAARRARELSIRTGTPFYVWKDGKVVDLNASPKPKPKPKRQPRRPSRAPSPHARRQARKR